MAKTKTKPISYANIACFPKRYVPNGTYNINMKCHTVESYTTYFDAANYDMDWVNIFILYIYSMLHLVLDFGSKQVDVINCPTEKRTELATKKVPYPTRAHKIFDGIPSDKKVKKGVHACKRLMLSTSVGDKKKKKID